MPNHWLKVRERKEQSRKVVLLVKGLPSLHIVSHIGLSFVAIDPRKPEKEIFWQILEPLTVVGYGVLRDCLLVWSHVYPNALDVGKGDVISVKLSDLDLEAVKNL